MRGVTGPIWQRRQAERPGRQADGHSPAALPDTFQLAGIFYAILGAEIRFDQLRSLDRSAVRLMSAQCSREQSHGFSMHGSADTMLNER
jgi:hypothetical protein